MKHHRVPLSVLDLAIISAGGTSASALAETTTLAQQAEALGYTRIWVAEHHNMPTVASTNPAVLIAHLAASTEKIVCGHITAGERESADLDKNLVVVVAVVDVKDTVAVATDVGIYPSTRVESE